MISDRLAHHEDKEKRRNELLFKIFKKLELKEFQPDEIIFKQGDLGHNMYLIVDGSVQVTLSRGLEAAGEFISKKGKVHIPAVVSKNTFLTESEEGRAREAAKIDWKNQILANVMHKGEAFGELALSVTTKRTATCLALEKTYAISLDKETFLRVLDAEVNENKYLFATLEKNFNYLRFVHSSEMISKIEKISCRMNQVLIDFKKVPEYIYMVRSGSVRVAVSLQDRNKAKLSRVVSENSEEAETRANFGRLRQ